MDLEQDKELENDAAGSPAARTARDVAGSPAAADSATASTTTPAPPAADESLPDMRTRLAILTSEYAKILSNVKSERLQQPDVIDDVILVMTAIKSEQVTSATKALARLRATLALEATGQRPVGG